MVLDWLTSGVERERVQGYGADMDAAREAAGDALPDKAYDIDVSEETYAPGTDHAEAVLGLEDDLDEVAVVTVSYRHDPHFDPDLARRTQGKARTAGAPPGLHFTDEKYPPGMRYPRIDGE